MIKDKRAKTVKQLIDTNQITKLSEIYDVIPVTVLVNFLKTNYTRLTKYNSNPSLFTMGEIIKLAKYFEVEEMIMIKIIYNQIAENGKKRKPTR